MASLTINEMRNFILREYPHARPNWRKMISTTNNTSQIIAIFHRINEKKAADAKAAMEKGCQSDNKPVEEFHQIDIYEYLATLNKQGSTTKIEV